MYCNVLHVYTHLKMFLVHTYTTCNVHVYTHLNICRIVMSFFSHLQNKSKARSALAARWEQQVKQRYWDLITN